MRNADDELTDTDELPDIVCGSSDGVAHVFSMNPSRRADPQLLANFQAALEEASKPKSTSQQVRLNQIFFLHSNCVSFFLIFSMCVCEEY